MKELQPRRGLAFFPVWETEARLNLLTSVVDDDDKMERTERSKELGNEMYPQR